MQYLTQLPATVAPYSPVKPVWSGLTVVIGVRRWLRTQLRKVKRVDQLSRGLDQGGRVSSRRAVRRPTWLSLTGTVHTVV